MGAIDAKQKPSTKIGAPFHEPKENEPRVRHHPVLEGVLTHARRLRASSAAIGPKNARRRLVSSARGGVCVIGP